MELNDIITLVKAGYTKNEIMQMAQPTPVPADSEPVQVAMDLPAPAAEPVPALVAEPVAVPVAQQAPQPAPVEEQPTMSQLMESIAKLTSAVQANAIAQSVIPAGISNPPSAEDMLAEIIRPTYKERV